MKPAHGAAQPIALRTNQIRRKKREQARKTALDRLVEKLEAHADEILDTYLGAIRGGDWRAAEALYDRVYGKSKQRHEVEASITRGPPPRDSTASGTFSQRRCGRRELEAESGPDSEEGG